MRILIVEDDQLLNNTLCYNLCMSGYSLDSALSKQQASNYIKKYDYDINSYTYYGNIIDTTFDKWIEENL